MSEYLTGEPLSKRIRKVMKGKQPRMCVAFLGPNWVREVFDDALPPEAKVICDLSMGVTVHPALKAGRAPNNKRLRHIAGTEMHAKVYLSDKGAVVCSANATQSALSTQNRIEDGIWVKVGSATYKAIKKRFKERYKAAVQVDKAALNAAPVYARWPNLPDGLTLVEILRRDPGAFHGIRFVCSTEHVNRAVRDEANRRLDEKDREDNADANAGPRGRREHFSNWDHDETDWPALFISVHRGPRGGFILSKQRHHRFLRGVQGEPRMGPEDVFVSHRLDWTASGAAFGDLPTLASHRECRNELRALFPGEASFEPFMGRVLSGPEFAKLLLEI